MKFKEILKFLQKTMPKIKINIKDYKMNITNNFKNSKKKYFIYDYLCNSNNF